MQQHRIISLLSIVVMLIIPVIGWFLIAQPQLTAASTADQQRADTAAQVTASQAVVARLKADSANLPKLRDELDELRGVIPSKVDPSGWIDGLSALAKVTKVEITALTVADPLAYSPAQAPNAPVVAPPASDSGDGDASATPVATPLPEAFPGIVTNSLVTSENFVAIPVTVEVTGTLPAVLRFVNGLQSDNRLYLVNTLETEPVAETGSKNITGKIGGFIWAIPTGEPGDPHPVSTIVKSMGPSKSDTKTPDPNSTATPDPNSTATPPPTNP